MNYLLIQKYRRAFYEFIYKSRRSSVSQEIFNDIMQISILEDIRLDEVKNNQHKEYFNIIKKLNIWFSLYEQFNLSPHNNNKKMASNLEHYRQANDRYYQWKSKRK